MPNSYLTENCQFLKETIFLDIWGPTVQKLEATRARQLYAESFVAGPYYIRKDITTCFAHSSISHQADGHSKKSVYSKRL